ITDKPSHQSCSRSLGHFRHGVRIRRHIGLRRRVVLSETVSDATGFVPCSCAYDTLNFPGPSASVVPRITINRFLFIYPHGMATAATNAADDAICATDRTFFNLLLPRTGLSGTTIVSPGPMVAESTLPDQKPPCFPPVTEPSERIMKIPPLFASAVGPPAWERYQLAFLPGVKVRALEL